MPQPKPNSFRIIKKFLFRNQNNLVLKGIQSTTWMQDWEYRNNLKVKSKICSLFFYSITDLNFIKFHAKDLGSFSLITNWSGKLPSFFFFIV